MKADVITIEGKKAKEIEVPEFFTAPVRQDIVMKCVEAKKLRQPYAPFEEAGKQFSASGNIRHGRRKWKTAYGKGISRVPRKIMWRRGDQFYWVGAETSGTRKGRRSHPPRVLAMQNHPKINKQELMIALRSALSATAQTAYVKQRYASLGQINLKLPLVAESALLEQKGKRFYESLKKILGQAFAISIQQKQVRAGKGKGRGRMYRKNAGLLLVIGKNEQLLVKGVDVQKADKLGVMDLAEGALGRITLYTEQALGDLRKRVEGK